MASFLSIWECGADISNYEHKFCTSCGQELLSDEKSIITFYFSRGFDYKSTLHMLSKQHTIKMSRRTLKNRLKEFGLRRKLALYDEIEVRRHRTRNGRSWVYGRILLNVAYTIDERYSSTKEGCRRDYEGT